MVKILRESKQDIENFKEQCKRACDIFGWDYDELIEKYFRMKDSIAAQRREYGDMTALAKKFKEYADIVNKQVKTQEEYTARMNLEKEVRAILTFIFEFKSKSELQRELKAGSKFIGEENGWKVYFITTVGAAQVMGKGTTWCITGRYPGHEDEAEKWFNHYINENCLDGYYFVINSEFDSNRPRETSSYKWCVLKSIDTDADDMLEIYNANQGEKYRGTTDCIEEGPEDFPWDLILDEDWFDLESRHMEEQIDEELNEMSTDDLDDAYQQIFEEHNGLNYSLVEDGLVDEDAFVELEDKLWEDQCDYVAMYLDEHIAELTDDEEEQEKYREMYDEDGGAFVEKLIDEGIVEERRIIDLFDYRYTPFDWFKDHATSDCDTMAWEIMSNDYGAEAYDKIRNTIAELKQRVFGDK